MLGWSIPTVLKEISLGYSYVEIGLILRESILLSKMLLSSEAWHKVLLYQIERLEDVDKTFLRQLFNAHAKTGVEFLYSESGAVPIRIKISVRRLLYWHHLLTVDESEMIQKVYLAQKLSPVSGDWILLLEEDKKQFGIKLSDKDVASLSKQKFRNYLLKKSYTANSQIPKEIKGRKVQIYPSRCE